MVDKLMSGSSFGIFSYRHKFLGITTETIQELLYVHTCISLSLSLSLSPSLQIQIALWGLASMAMIWTEVYSFHGDETSIYTVVQEQEILRLTGSLQMGQKLALLSETFVKATSQMAPRFCKLLATAGFPCVMLEFILVSQTALG